MAHNLADKACLIAFAAIVALSLLGAWFAGNGLHLVGIVKKLGVLALLLVCASAAPEIRAGVSTQPLVLCLGAGLLLGAVIFAIELNFDAPLYRFFSGKGWDGDVALSRFNRGSTALVLLSWPAAAGMWLAGRHAAALALVLAGLAVASIGRVRLGTAGGCAWAFYIAIGSSKRPDCITALIHARDIVDDCGTVAARQSDDLDSGLCRPFPAVFCRPAGDLAQRLHCGT